MPATGHAADPCSPPVNAVACENSKPGTAPSDWQTLGAGDASIQGFATSMSTNVGQTVSFKIKTSGSNYHIDILRLGYYQGLGARKIATINSPTARTQPTCLTAPATGLIDCGNWGVSASWAVPSTAVSGVYIAHLVRNDNGDDSQIPFVVRDDASHSKILLQTSDATWQAYNTYGGNSLYKCTVACPPGDPRAYKAAYAVSYNRPIADSGDAAQSYLYYAEYQMIRWVERQGYDVSYTSQADVDANGALLQNHQLFMSSGHDEYWSKGQRDNVTAARDAGVNLAFFSGNEVFWKTRWANSSDGSNTPRRTLITYKETHFDSPVDPQDPPTWTGTWTDPRFSPPGDAGKPQNSLTGQFFTINAGTSDIKVPGKYASLRFWRKTAVANLTPSQTLTLSPNTGTLGYEWDEDLDNGSRPAGLFQMSSTTVSGLDKFIDYGSTVQSNSTATHHLTLYKAPSGALVFGAGTVQWSWGLDNTNAWDVPTTDPSGNAPDVNIQQATVNLFADMGVQPFALSTGLQAVTQSTDTTAPTATISSPAANANLQDGANVTISGTASDVGGVVSGVEVSTDGGSTWHPATGTTSWTYPWIVHGSPSTTIKVRAVDDSANLGTPSSGVPINVGCACTLWGNQTPPTVDSGDTTSVEVGVKFKSDKFGTINGIRFYKAAGNTGTHIGSLWSADGTRLAQATFSGESASGWQQVTFASPVSILPDTTYIASYFAPVGHYAASSGWFYVPSPTGGNSIDSPPLHAISANGNGANGLYLYTSSSAFPTQSYGASNYWVDVMFTPSTPPGTVTNVSATAGPGQAHVTWNAPTSGGAPTSYKITPYIGSTAQTPTTINGSPPATSADISGLTGGQTYTFTVQAINPLGNGPVSSPSNAVTPTVPTAPTAPGNVTASAASASAFVNWSVPSSDGGGAITGYTVTPYIGSTAQTPVSVPASATSKQITGLTNDTSYTFKVTATNSIGTGPAGTSNGVTPRKTIFDWATPAMVDSNDNNAVVLGVKFKSDVSGLVTGVRFYKGAANTGTHIGSLWSAGGSKLAEATFTNESATGWQSVNFASPVLITAGTTYVAAYLAPNGRYSATSPGLTSAIDNAPLHAISNTVDANGVYRYGTTNAFPTNTFNASNYFVDVMFTSVTTPGKVTDVAATAGSGSARVTWSAPGGGPVTSYKITPYIGSTAQTATTITGSPPATAATITGLTGGTSYTFTVQAINSDGSGPVSDPSNAVTPTGASSPGAPGSVSATAATSSARVTWDPPSDDGGRAITGYTVTPFVGTTAGTPIDTTGTSATITGLTNGTSYTFKVTATNSIGTGPAGTSNATTPLNTIFDWATPDVVDSGDTAGVELGVKFKSDVAGTVTGIRFYKAAANTGTHVGGLWTSTGTALSSATFSGETASGWQEVDFATPVAITAGTTYVAGYFAPNGHYSATAGGLGSSADNGPLHTIPNGISPNGVYAYGLVSAFPTSSYNSTNYYVDVMFAPGS